MFSRLWMMDEWPVRCDRDVLLRFLFKANREKFVRLARRRVASQTSELGAIKVALDDSSSFFRCYSWDFYYM